MQPTLQLTQTHNILCLQIGELQNPRPFARHLVVCNGWNCDIDTRSGASLEPNGALVAEQRDSCLGGWCDSSK